MTRRIHITQGYVTLVDDEDYARVAGYSWRVRRATKRKELLHVITTDRITSKTLSLHRVILGLTESTPDVDHIDGDGLNNTRKNMRVVSRSVNMFNTYRHRIRNARLA
jgi:hypothetical protein